MKKQIIQSINDPEALEMLYRKDKSGFTLDFPEASAGIENDLVRFWQIRLKKETSGQKNQLLKTDFWIVAILSIVIALLVKAHLIFGNMTMEDFWFRNLTTIAFAGLTAWFILKNRITGVKNILLLALPVVILTIFYESASRKAGRHHHAGIYPCPFVHVVHFRTRLGFFPIHQIHRKFQLLSAITVNWSSCTDCYASREPFFRA